MKDRNRYEISENETKTQIVTTKHEHCIGEDSSEDCGIYKRTPSTTVWIELRRNSPWDTVILPTMPELSDVYVPSNTLLIHRVSHVGLARAPSLKNDPPSIPLTPSHAVIIQMLDHRLMILLAGA